MHPGLLGNAVQYIARKIEIELVTNRSKLRLMEEVEPNFLHIESESFDIPFMLREHYADYDVEYILASWDKFCIMLSTKVGMVHISYTQMIKERR